MGAVADRRFSEPLDRGLAGLPSRPETVGTSQRRCGMAASLCAEPLSASAARCPLYEVGAFYRCHVQGRGFVALPAIVVGRWTPFAALFGFLLFSAIGALELGVPWLESAGPPI